MQIIAFKHYYLYSLFNDTNVLTQTIATLSASIFDQTLIWKQESRLIALQ